MIRKVKGSFRWCGSYVLALSVLPIILHVQSTFLTVLDALPVILKFFLYLEPSKFCLIALSSVGMQIGTSRMLKACRPMKAPFHHKSSVVCALKSHSSMGMGSCHTFQKNTAAVLGPYLVLPRDVPIIVLPQYCDYSLKHV